MDDVNYEKVLEDLRRRRQELDGAIAVIERVIGHAPIGARTDEGQTPSDPGSSEIRSDTFFGMNVPDAIKKYLGMAKRPKTAADIARALEAGGIMSQAKNFYANVSTSIRRLDERGEIVQLPDTKEWGMASWYPARPKAANGPRKGGGEPGEQVVGGDEEA